MPAPVFSIGARCEMLQGFNIINRKNLEFSPQATRARQLLWAAAQARKPSGAFLTWKIGGQVGDIVPANAGEVAFVRVRIVRVGGLPGGLDGEAAILKARPGQGGKIQGRPGRVAAGRIGR
jgi:hypothetical protein